MVRVTIMLMLFNWRAGLVQAVESYRLWPEGPRFESWSPRIAQARVRLATNTLHQTPHRAGALCTGYAPFNQSDSCDCLVIFLVIDLMAMNIQILNEKGWWSVETSLILVCVLWVIMSSCSVVLNWIFLPLSCNNLWFFSCFKCAMLVSIL